MCFKKLLVILCTACVLLLFIVYSDISIAGVNRGLLISANVIIPSLFPFTVIVLMIIKIGINIKNKYINIVIQKIFGFDFELFLVFALSLIGGYPIGAKLIAELYKKDKIKQKAANVMLLYCVNAGPAFIVTAVGIGVFNSSTVGIVLFFSHIISSIIFATVMSKKMNGIKTNYLKSRVVTFSQIFTESVADATAAILQICSFIILFSAIAAYLEYFFNDIPILDKLIYFIEVTLGVNKSNNIYFASFLLGFSGVSIWFQIFAITKDIKISYMKFIIGRLLHGTLSSLITILILKVFKINVSVFNNQIIFQKESLYSNIPIAFSLLIMVTVLLIYLYSKNSSRKFIDDMV